MRGDTTHSLRSARQDYLERLVITRPSPALGATAIAILDDTPGLTGTVEFVIARKTIQARVSVRNKNTQTNQTVTLLAVALHKRGSFPHRRRAFADKEAARHGAAIGSGLLRTHFKPLSHVFPPSVLATPAPRENHLDRAQLDE